MKARIVRMLVVVGTLLGTVTAHYLGFLNQLPDEIILIVGLTLATTFAGDFLAQLAVITVVARVAAVAIATLVSIFSITVARLLEHSNSKFLRLHAVIRARQDKMVGTISLLVFISIFSDRFMQSPNWGATIGWIFVLVFFVSVLVNLSLFGAPKRILDLHKAIRVRRTSDQIAVLGSSASLIWALAYMTGHMRYEIAIKQVPVNINYPSVSYSGEAKVLYRASKAILVIEQIGNSSRYCLLDENFQVCR